MATTTAATATKTMTLLKRLDKILAQDRGVLNFVHYVPSPEHTRRLKQLQKLAPQLYDNPEITPRDKWFDHAMFRRNSQMPPYHVHFRQELQRVLGYLKQAHTTTVTTSTVNANNTSETTQYCQRAYQVFVGSMRGLQGHVSIEEYACFPLYQRKFPDINVDFLWEDHEALHDHEQQVEQCLQTLAQQKSRQEQDILQALETTLEFDDHLMAHLGEEEEIVVPLSLTAKRIHF